MDEKTDSTNAINPQDGNTGNVGDILKHAALVALARLLRRRSGCTATNYLDTHAYRIHSTLSNRGWRTDLARLARRYPVYHDYEALERPYVARDAYLCSTGLVIECLRTPALYLSESDAVTRAALTGQLAERSLQPAVLLSDAADWGRAGGPLDSGPLLGLVDPFALTRDTWIWARRAVARLWNEEADGLLELFAYQDDPDSRTSWPPPPAGWVGPVATVHRFPYFLAAYATSSVAPPAGNALAALGWRLG